MRTDALTEAKSPASLPNAVPVAALINTPAIKPASDIEKAKTGPSEETRAAVAATLAAKGPANSSLIIERDEGSGRYIYKSVDRDSGAVTQIWPIRDVRAAVSAHDVSDKRGAALDARY